MIIRSAGYYIKSLILKRRAERLGIFEYLLLIFPEFGCESFAQCHRLCSDYVHKRAALRAGENSLIYLRGILFLAENKSAARSAEGFVGCGGHNIGIRHRRGVKPCGYKSRNMRHIHH